MECSLATYTSPAVRPRRGASSPTVCAAAQEYLYDRFYGARVAESDPIEVIREAFDLIYTMNLRLPTRFVTLDKAIATLGAVGVELYPDFNVFEVAKPYARDLLVQRFTPRRIAARARREGWKLTQ